MAKINEHKQILWIFFLSELAIWANHDNLTGVNGVILKFIGYSYLFHCYSWKKNYYYSNVSAFIIWHGNILLTPGTMCIQIWCAQIIFYLTYYKNYWKSYWKQDTFVSNKCYKDKYFKSFVYHDAITIVYSKHALNKRKKNIHTRMCI